MNDHQLMLLTEAPPPACPVDAGSPEQWDEVEGRLGTILPSDYKWLINIGVTQLMAFVQYVHFAPCTR